MIAVISKGDFLKGAVLYNETKVKEGEASVIDIRNVSSEEEECEYLESADALSVMMLQCWKKEEDGNAKLAVKQPVFSCSLNLNQEDLDKLQKIREEQGEEAENEFYRKIAGRYMEGMGYGEQPYIVYKHEDIERTHIHIISIRVDKNRRKINDSNEKLRSERVRKEIAREFGLSEEGEKKSRKMTKKELLSMSEKRSEFISRTGSDVTELARLDPSDKSNLTKIRHKISNILKFVDENYKPKNMSEYNKILSQFHIRCNRIDTIDKEGRRINGCQFGVINAKGEYVTHLIKGGQVNEKFTLPKLESKFALANGQAKDIRKEDSFSKKYITDQIKSILESPRLLDMDYFCSTLRARGIEANIVTDNDEKTVGVNFIDNLNGKVFTGSSLGREFSWFNLSAKIESHNRKLESGSLEKEAFTAAVKRLTSMYNEIRKESYYLESDLIKDLPQKKEEMMRTLQNEQLLTERQAEKCFDAFFRFKTGNLPSVEAKENSYQQSQILTALAFANKMREDQQGRADFLHRMGVSLTTRNGAIAYVSERKPDVWLTYANAKEMNHALLYEEPIRTVVSPSEGTAAFSKTERMFVKDISEGGDGSQIKGNVIKMLDLLDRKNLDIAINGNIVKMFSSLVNPLRTKAFKESGLLESDFIRSLDNVKEAMVEKAMENLDITRETAEAIYEKYRSYQRDTVLKDVESREEKAATNRIEMSLRFASLIEDPSKKTEFLKRMEVRVTRNGGGIVFTYERKPQFGVSSEEIKERTGITVSPQSLIFADMKAEPFSKKERDFVKDYLSGENMMDGRYATALSYLDQSEQDKAKRTGVETRVARILDAVSSASADEMVRALLYRGFVIHPVSDQGRTSYKVSRFNSRKEETMADLPHNLAERLDNSNFAQVYPKIKDQLLAKGMYGTAKLVAVMKISRAGDFKDEALLHSTIDDVAKVNPLLADKMREAATPVKDGEIDYGRVARLVAEYKGEKTIKLPPPSANMVKRKTVKEMSAIVDELRNGNTLETAVRLLREDKEIEEQQNKQQQEKRKL